LQCEQTIQVRVVIPSAIGVLYLYLALINYTISLYHHCAYSFSLFCGLLLMLLHCRRVCGNYCIVLYLALIDSLPFGLSFNIDHLQTGAALQCEQTIQVRVVIPSAIGVLYLALIDYLPLGLTILVVCREKL
jgi:hypothetical protein